MLSRTADNLYWLARYIERAENLARIVEVCIRMAMMPDESGERHRSEWHSALVNAGCEPLFKESGQPINAGNVVEFICRAERNPSSIYSCLKTARDNGRAVRNSLTTETWECLNDTWLALDEHWAAAAKSRDFRPFLDWVKERSSLFRACLAGTMIRDEAFHFLQLGTFIERADNTARILDVKYHILLPENAEVGGGVDYYQWTTILRAVSALGSYHWVYSENPRPWLIAELLILREEMPRSLVTCLREITQTLETLAEAHGRRHACHRQAGRLYSSLKFAVAEDIFQEGLHEFLSDFMVRNNRLGNEIERNYLFVGT